MKSKGLLPCLRGGTLATAVGMMFGLAASAQVPATHKTENVIVVMMDGMRRQEVYRGADPNWAVD